MFRMTNLRTWVMAVLDNRGYLRSDFRNSPRFNIHSNDELDKEGTQPSRRPLRLGLVVSAFC
jgi:hypothetical protein